jgi:hypothetical protein
MPNTDRLEVGITAFRDPNTGAWDVRTFKVHSERQSHHEMITAAQSILEKTIYMLQEEYQNGPPAFSQRPPTPPPPAAANILGKRSRENQDDDILPSVEDPAEFVQPKRPRLAGTSRKHPIVIEDDEDGRRSPSFSPRSSPRVYNIPKPDPNPIFDQKASPSEEPSIMPYVARRRTTSSGEPSCMAYVANSSLMPSLMDLDIVAYVAEQAANTEPDSPGGTHHVGDRDLWREVIKQNHDDWFGPDGVVPEPIRLFLENVDGLPRS